jgi:hypothetical protein
MLHIVEDIKPIRRKTRIWASRVDAEIYEEFMKLKGILKANGYGAYKGKDMDKVLKYANKKMSDFISEKNLGPK